MGTDPNLAPHWDASALVTIDVQGDFLSDGTLGVAGTTEVLPALHRLAATFRAADRPVIHVVRLYAPDGSDADLVRRTQLAGGARIVAPGSAGSQLAPGLRPDGAPDLDAARLLGGEPQDLGPREYAVYKPRWGAFYRTPLHDLLTRLGVDTVVLSGCNFPNCPRASLIEASERDYRTVLVTDAVSQGDPRGFAEISRIGVGLMTVAAVAHALDRPAVPPASRD